MKSRVLLLTGTRADFGKQKRLMRALQDDPDFELEIFVTGMHLLREYGSTLQEVRKAGLHNLHLYANQIPGEPMDLVLSNTVAGLARHVHEWPPDLFVVHGDRVEALATAIVGSFRNIRTVHVEGGELSGTIDGSIRHSITKHAHIHMVANEEARRRVMQLGERHESVFVVGSPEVDVMLSGELPSLEEVRKHYELPRGPYSVVAFHPVTTEREDIGEQAEELVAALLQTEGHFVVVDPNNDEGTTDIKVAYRKLANNNRFHRFPSLRFEAYLELLRQAEVVVGNSSSGVREAPVFGTASVDVGTRQSGRAVAPSIWSVRPERNEIAEAIGEARKAGRFASDFTFGEGGATDTIMELLKDENLWKLPLTKAFCDRQ